MMFHTAKDAIVTLLGDAAESRFRVIGYGRQSKGANEVLKNNRLVQVSYSSGQFPKSRGRRQGPKTHEANFDIMLTCSAKCEGDLSILESETATMQQKAAALASISEAAEVADNLMDELIHIVFGILMDARNDDLSLPIGDISSRWLDSIQKDTIPDRGDLVVKTAMLKYSCTLQEAVIGDIGVSPGSPLIDAEIPANDTGGAGVIIEN